MFAPMRPDRHQGPPSLPSPGGKAAGVCINHSPPLKLLQTKTSISIAFLSVDGIRHDIPEVRMGFHKKCFYHLKVM